MAIPRDFINDLIARTDIVELINHKVPLKKNGKNHSACCPFHNEKSPSFTVSRDKQFYHCFGCGAHGNAIDFLMEYDRLEFVDAIEELAGQFGLEVPRDTSRTNKSTKEQTDLYQLMEKASQFYIQSLRAHNEKQQAQDYLAQRGLSQEIIKKFGIGFAPNSWDSLLTSYPYQPEIQGKLIATGMIIAKDNGKCYDRFRNRIMFPIRDRRGRVIAFGGRVLDDATPKYLNSPETNIYHKGRELYGLYELKQAHKEIEQVLIVEGYMDVVALAQYGINYAVASLGTSTTTEQLQLLLRNSKQIICCYDGDAAGFKAAWRTLETALPLIKPGDQIQFMFLPEGEDPDSLVRNIGKEAFTKLIHNAKNLTSFVFDHLSEKYVADKGSYAQQAILLIEKIQDTILQNLLLEQLAHRLGMNDADDIRKKLGLHSQAKTLTSNNVNVKGRGTPLRLAVALLTQNPKLGYKMPLQPALTHLQMKGVNLLTQLLDITREEQLTTAQLLEYFREHAQLPALKKLAQWEHQVAENNCEQEFKNALIWLTNQYIEQRYQTLSMKQTHTKEEKIQLQKLIAVMKNHN